MGSNPAAPTGPWGRWACSSTGESVLDRVTVGAEELALLKLCEDPLPGSEPELAPPYVLCLRGYMVELECSIVLPVAATDTLAP